MDKSVLVLGADPKSVSLLQELSSKEEISWAYLGDDLIQFQDIKQQLDSIGPPEETSSRFYETSFALRESYVRFQYDMGCEVNSFRWWLTSLSFRSNYASKTFYWACWLRVALDLIYTWDSNRTLVLLVQASLLRRAINTNLRKESPIQVCVVDTRRRSPLKNVFNNLLMLGHRTFFLSREFRRLFLTRIKAPKRYQPTEPTTLLISSISYRSIHLADDFHSFFFGDLVQRLKALGNRMALVPIIQRGVAYKQALSGLHDSPTPVMAPYRYVRLSDILKAAVSSIRPVPVPRSIDNFLGMDIGLLVRDEITDYRYTNWAADSMLVLAMVKRWADMGISLNRIIYIYENQPWERALCFGARQYFPNTEMVGYQHARAPKHLLSFYIAPDGEPEAPLPDKVVTIGSYTANLLTASGYHPGQVRVGGTLNRQGIPSEIPQNDKSPEDLSRLPVLIMCSIGMEESAELAYMAINLFSEDDGIRLIFKFHPGMPFRRVKDRINAEFPAHVEISEESVDELIARSSVMVYSGSTVCIGALAVGLPVIHLRPQFDFDMDPLEAAPQNRLEAIELDDLREKIRWLLDNHSQYIAEHQAGWQTVVGEMFGPVSQETYSLFVDSK